LRHRSTAHLRPENQRIDRPIQTLKACIFLDITLYRREDMKREHAPYPSSVLTSFQKKDTRKSNA
jgi:hypothetical protein